MVSHADDTFPSSLVPVITFGRQHGARETQGMTFRKAAHTGRLPVVTGHWKQGRKYIDLALDAAGRRRFWSLWHEADWFIACPDCPHELPDAGDGG